MQEPRDAQPEAIDVPAMIEATADAFLAHPSPPKDNSEEAIRARAALRFYIDAGVEFRSAVNAVLIAKGGSIGNALVNELSKHPLVKTDTDGNRAERRRRERAAHRRRS